MDILNKIRANRIGYKLGRSVLSSKSFTENQLYDKIYNAKINKTIQKLNLSPPEGVDIGVTNHCNANCIMCPHSKLKEVGFMDMGSYRKIIDECVEFGVKYVTLSFFGEPLLDKHLIERILYAKTKSLKVYFYSNASLLNDSWAHQLIMAGLDGITISFDSNKKETYERIRRNLKFDVVKSNILNLIELRNEKNSQLKINLVIVELEENKDEIKSLYKEWSKKVDSINIINMRNWADAIDKQGTRESFHYGENKNRVPCALLWQKMVVDWNCDVVLCCDDWEHKVVLGNLKKQTVKEVWEGDKLKTIRYHHLNREFHKLPLCNNCNKKTVWWLVR